MKTIRMLLTGMLIAATIVSCKKDNIENGPLALKPHDFLASKNYESMIVEIAYVSGHQPTNDAVNHVVDFLKARLNKPGGISVAYTSIASPGLSSYSLGDIEQVEKDHRAYHTRGGRIAAFAFFADAPYAGDASVLGVAYGTTSLAVFEKTVEDNSGGLAQPSRFVLEATVAEHEFGHLLGLVDNGSPMQHAHQDPNHANHCDNSSCLMYYAAETTDIVANLIGGDVPDLDANCIADLQANGGK